MLLRFISPNKLKFINASSSQFEIRLVFIIGNVFFSLVCVQMSFRFTLANATLKSISIIWKRSVFSDAFWFCYFIWPTLQSEREKKNVCTDIYADCCFVIWYEMKHVFFFLYPNLFVVWETAWVYFEDCKVEEIEENERVKNVRDPCTWSMNR